MERDMERDMGTILGTPGWAWGHWGGTWGHQDGHGDNVEDTRMGLGTPSGTWGQCGGHGDIGGDTRMGLGTLGWTWGQCGGHRDGLGDTERDMGTTLGTPGCAWGHWDGTGDSVGTLGWPWGHREGHGDRGRRGQKGHEGQREGHGDSDGHGDKRRQKYGHGDPPEWPCPPQGTPRHFWGHFLGRGRCRCEATPPPSASSQRSRPPLRRRSAPRANGAEKSRKEPNPEPKKVENTRTLRAEPRAGNNRTAADGERPKRAERGAERTEAETPRTPVRGRPCLEAATPSRPGLFLLVLLLLFLLLRRGRVPWPGQGAEGGSVIPNWAQTGPNWAELGRRNAGRSEVVRKEPKRPLRRRRCTELTEPGRKLPNRAGSKRSGSEVTERSTGRDGKNRAGPEPGRKEPKVSGNCRSAAMLLSMLLGLLEVLGVHGGCVEVASGTEAVLGSSFRLLCIACKRRSETPAEAESEWFFRPEGAPHFQKILHYSPEEEPWVAPGPFRGVLSWNGSKGTRDLQDLSVFLETVDRAHAGLYICRLKRNLTFEGYTYSLARNQTLKLAVVEKARRDLASIVSEILMYVLIVVLTLWLAAEMLYCYRKVAAAAPPPDSASEYLAITSESKENCGGVQVAE